jgi:hypothetical protein
MLSTGDIVQTVISYVSKDYTGERSSYLAHSLIIEDSEIESVYHNNGFDAFNPEMFIRDISAFNLTARNAGANPGLAKLNYIPGRMTNGRAVVSEYDPQMVKSFIFSVVSAILGEGKPVLFRLPYGDDQLSERALDFINSLMSILPYGLRKQLSFVSYVSRPDAYEGFNLKCLGASCGAVDSSSYVLYDFEQLASVFHVRAGINAARAHLIEFVNHQFFHVFGKRLEPARGGFIVGNDKLIQRFLVYVRKQIVLNSYFFHNPSPCRFLSGEKNNLFYYTPYCRRNQRK